ncbi:MAG: Nif3-like dinuclear metal center hexameric protein [Desulfovibrionaceae bacterium]|nr:Nif3-like dinuclear metal center hexameric protein [Desulfovibrionaceae bacterium]
MDTTELKSLLNSLAPLEYACAWDNCGVQVAGRKTKVRKIAVCLEPAPEALARCLDWGAEFIVSHHPLYLAPKAPNKNGPYLEALGLLLPAGAWLYAAHTCLDCRPDGPAQWLGRELGLIDCAPLEVTAEFGALEAFFVAQEPVQKNAAEAWADSGGVYSVTQNAQAEVRLICEAGRWPELARRIEAELGERPLFHVRRLAEPSLKVGLGHCGRLPRALGPDAFLKALGRLLAGTRPVLCGPEPKKIEVVAVCPGSGSSLIGAAAAAGADVLVTGDVKYHAAVEAGILVLDVGHFALEERMMEIFAQELARKATGAKVRFFPGQDPFRSAPDTGAEPRG